MEQFLAMMGDLHGTVWERYPSYEVALSYQGRSVAYKALYLIAAAAEQHHAQPIDMYLRATRYSQFPMAYRPDRIFRSKLRDVPAVHDWLATHTVPDSTCSAREMNSLCCAGSRCGLRQQDFDRKMSWPLSGDAPRPTPSPFSVVKPLVEGESPRSRVDPRSFDLTVPCPHCGYRIPPAEILRTGWSTIRCPACEREFDSMAGKQPPSTS
jgi:hypothetical protein